VARAYRTAYLPSGKFAGMATITIAPYDPAWPERFGRFGALLRHALEPVLGDRLSRIDHIGSTSVPGLGAKPIIDIQVSVRGFYPADDPAAPGYEPPPPPPGEFRPVGYRGETPADDPLAAALMGIGLTWAGDWCTDRRKWLFLRRVSDPAVSDPTVTDHAVTGFSVNVHVRREGCVSQQQALLFRDYLRAQAHARRRYEEVKRRLADDEWDAVDDYADAKGDCVWALLREADGWTLNGWRPGPTDA
jgi:GrpB-like predicted nucleotidyltransferase (UPF0157 family)